MRIFVFTCLIGCGSVQSINGVRLKKPLKNQHNKVLVGVATFGLGYYLGSELLPKRKK